MTATWAYQEAEKVLALVQKKGKTIATFECGFGPSGSPHIGTVAEMLRTRMVIEAFCDITRNLAPPGEHPESYYQINWVLFADNLDSLRKVPNNVPNPKEMEQYLGIPVCDIPDPWGRDKSFAEHNIRDLHEALARFGYTLNDYSLFRASDMYRPMRSGQPGLFNDAIIDFAFKANEIKDIVTHDYKDERTASYCPFLPISKNRKTQIDLYNWDIQEIDTNKGPIPMVLYYHTEPNSTEMNTHPILNGGCKLQWKADWPLRWYALDVDYEMHGKDLLGSAQVGDRIMRLMNREPPIHMMYELFLNEEGQKISKSDGSNDALQQWTDYTLAEVLMHFLSLNPRKSRKLHFGIIPQTTDAWLSDQGESVSPISFSMLLNLVSITNTEDPDLIWDYIDGYSSGANKEQYPVLDLLIQKAINYYRDYILPNKNYRDPTANEMDALNALASALGSVNIDEDEITKIVYDIGKQFYGENKDSLRNFFQMIYEVLMGQTSGPRLPVFILLFGVNQFINLIRTKTQ